jgi:hypothetical protein
MTTNVFDSNAGMIATDSRWSITWGRWVSYLDDAQFHKIELNRNFAYMFAGDGARIQEWKNWIRSNPLSLKYRPPTSKMAVCMVDTDAGEVTFMDKLDIVNGGGYFAGTGAMLAFTCWASNGCAETSVKTAMNFDIYTGGEVKFFNAASKKHNLHLVSRDVDIYQVSKAIQERGIIMELQSKNINAQAPFTLATAANDGASRAEFVQKIASGELTPIAPCNGMYSDWTTEQETRLNAALTKAFGWQ